MYYRLKSSRPTYSAKRFENDFQQSVYYENLHKNNVTNPCMFFETPESFKRNLFFGIRKEMKMSLSNDKRASTAYPGNKSNFDNDTKNASWLKNKDNFVPNSALPGQFPSIK